MINFSYGYLYSQNSFKEELARTNNISEEKGFLQNKSLS